MKAEEFLKALNGIDSKFIDEADEYNSEKSKSVSIIKNKYFALITVSAAAVVLIVSANHFTDFHDSNNYEAENMITETYSYSSESTDSTLAAAESSVSKNTVETTCDSQVSDTSVSGQMEIIISETFISYTDTFEKTDIPEPVSVSVTEKTDINEPVSVTVTPKTDITEIFTSDVSSDTESQIPLPPPPEPCITTSPSIIPDIFYDADKKYTMIYQKEAEYGKTGQKISNEKLIFYSEKGEDGEFYDIYSVSDNDESNLIIIRISGRYYIYKKLINEPDREE